MLFIVFLWFIKFLALTLNHSSACLQHRRCCCINIICHECCCYYVVAVAVAVAVVVAVVVVVVVVAAIFQGIYIDAPKLFTSRKGSALLLGVLLILPSGLSRDPETSIHRVCGACILGVDRRISQLWLTVKITVGDSEACFFIFLRCLCHPRIMCQCPIIMCQYVVYFLSKVQAFALFFVIFHMSFPCNKKNLRLASGDGFELQVSPSCAALSPGEACLIGCRWPFVGQVVIAQCPVGNTDRFQAVDCGRLAWWVFQVKGWLVLWELPAGIDFVENLMGHRWLCSDQMP